MTTKPLLELCLIVKDSGERITKALESWKDHIDYWTILDTGSTDGTQKRILDALKNVPGKLFEESNENFAFDCFGNKEVQQRLIKKFGKLPFDFAKARNRSLDLCSKHCEFIITIDDTYVIKNPDMLRQKLNNIKDKPHHAFLIYIHNVEEGKPDTWNSVQSTRIIRSNKGFKWVNPIHELLDVGTDPIANITLNNDTYIYDEIDGYYNERSTTRHKRDIEVLGICYDHAKEIKVKSRYAYYAAQTAIILRDNDAAGEWLKKRIDTDGEPSAELYHALTQYARYTKDRIHSDRAIEMYPQRLEAYLESAIVAHHNKCYNVAYAYLKHGIFFHDSTPDKELMFVSLKLDLFKLIVKMALRFGHHSDAVIYVKRGLECCDTDPELLKYVDICKKLGIWDLYENAKNIIGGNQSLAVSESLNNPLTSNLNNKQFNQIINSLQTTSTNNQVASLTGVVQASNNSEGYQEIVFSDRPNKRIVFATDATSTGPWDGTSLNVRGSETSIIKTANMLASIIDTDNSKGNKGKAKFEVIVFCNTPYKDARVIKGVTWCHISILEPFIDKNDVDYMICVRSVNILNLLNKYIRTVRNHYFWIHDMGINGESLCLSKIAFRKMIYVSEFQRTAFMETFNFPESICTVIPNGIDVRYIEELEAKTPNWPVNKIKNRFIYSSDANRGLFELLTVFPTIRKLLPGATLHIYCSLDQTDADVFEKGEYKNVCLSNLKKIKEMVDKYGDFVTVHGRVNKNVLYYGFAQAEYWFYPCAFIETFCITAIEAQYFKCKVVCNDLGALKDTVKSGMIYDYRNNIYDTVAKFVCFTDWKLEDGYQWALMHSYDNIKDKWIKILEN